MREKKLLWQRVILKKVTLPNGQTFYARYKRTSRRNLPRNVTIRKNRRIGTRQQRTRKMEQGGWKYIRKYCRIKGEIRGK